MVAKMKYTLSKGDLVQEVVTKSHLPAKESVIAIEAILATIESALRKGEDIVVDELLLKLPPKSIVKKSSLIHRPSITLH